MQITQYVKEHPWATGIIVIVGGFIFLMIFRGGSSDSSGGGGTSRPSDAEVAANAQVAAAQIAANAQSSQAGAAVQAAQIGAGVQMNADNKAAEVAMRALDVQKELGITATNAEKEYMIAGVNAKNQQYQTIVSALPSIKKKNRDDVLKSLVTGEYGYQGAPGPGTITQIGNAAGGIAKAIGSIGSLFSDQRLKENIKLLGYDSKGLGIYEWNYKGSKRKYRGYIAQEVARSHPEAVQVDPGTGYWKVNTLALASI